MPYWEDCELEDNIWDGFARNDNSTVPYQCDEQLNESQAKIDVNNKSQNEVNVETSTANITSETESINLLKDGSTFSFKDGSNNCAFSISDASPSVNLNLPETENYLLYYDYPVIDNFEDVDRMFRNCDSTYGQQQADNTDCLLWLPSSNTIYGPEVALQPGLSSLCSELDLLNDSDSNLLCEIAPVAASANYQFNVDWVDAVADNNGKCVLKAQCIQAYEGGEIEQSTFSQIQNTSSSSGCENLDSRIGSQYSSTENKMQQLVNQKLSAASASKPHAAQNVLKQKQPLDNASSSSYMDSISPYSEFDYSFRPLEVSFPMISSVGGFKECEANPSFPKAVCFTSDEANPCTKFARKEVRKLQNRHLMHETVMGDHRNQEASTVKALLSGKPHKSQCDIDSGEHENRRTEVPQVGIDSLHLLDSSILTSLSTDGISLEETSLKQLQDVMNKLDVKTKLCIRDGLYRLARSAKQRNYFSSPTDCNGESGDARRAQNTEALDKSVDQSSAETETNPIDRSIAHLLFHCPSGPRTRTVEDATSLESSHMTNEQSQVPTNNQDAVPNPLLSRKQFGNSSNA